MTSLGPRGCQNLVEWEFQATDWLRSPLPFLPVVLNRAASPLRGLVWKFVVCRNNWKADNSCDSPQQRTVPCPQCQVLAQYWCAWKAWSVSRAWAELCLNLNTTYALHMEFSRNVTTALKEREEYILFCLQLDYFREFHHQGDLVCGWDVHTAAPAFMKISCKLLAVSFCFLL